MLKLTRVLRKLARTKFRRSSAVFSADSRVLISANLDFNVANSSERIISMQLRKKTDRRKQFKAGQVQLYLLIIIVKRFSKKNKYFKHC